MKTGELPIGFTVKTLSQRAVEGGVGLGRELVLQHRKLVSAILGAIAKERRAHVEEQLKQDKKIHTIKV